MCTIVYGTTSSATSIGETDMSGAERFTQTSDKPYDRHHYQMELSNGEKHTFESYQEAQAFWFHRYQLGYLKCIHVIDKPKPKKKQTKAKGF